MAFNQRSWIARQQKMGDESEGIFEQVYPKGWTRYGLRRPPIRVDRLPRFIRYTPDYLTTDNLVEVMGVGEDQILKLKTEKLGALEDWHDSMDVKLFLWDSHKKRHCMVDYNTLAQAVMRLGKLGSFPEGKAYWGVDVNDLEAEWESLKPK